jgi:hypothetical protein
VNPDGHRSDPATVGAVISGALSPPRIISVFPGRIASGGSQAELTITGTDFGVVPQVELTRDDSSPIRVSLVAATATALKVALPAAPLSTPGTIGVRVLSGGLTSDGALIRVVSPGEPPPPTIEVVEPAEISTAEDTVLTLRGTGYQVTDSVVRIAVADDFLMTEVISPTEIRTTVPAGLTRGSGPLHLWVASAADLTLVSNVVTVTLVDPTGVLAAPPPAITHLEPRQVAYVRDGETEVSVVIRGTGFQPDAAVDVRIDDESFSPVSVTHTGANELTVTLPAEAWRDRQYIARYTITTQAGAQQAIRFVGRRKVHVRLQRGAIGVNLGRNVWRLEPNVAADCQPPIDFTAANDRSPVIRS